MREGFYGVYMTPEREIRIDLDSSVEDLLFVIGKLADELEWWKRERMGLDRNPFKRPADSASGEPK